MGVARLDVDHDGRSEMGDRVAVPGPLVDLAMGDRVGLAFWDCVAMTRAVLPDVQRGLNRLHGPAPTGRR